MAEGSGSSKRWQQDLVLLSKNVYVWLHQLSRKYSRDITTLDQIPMQEFEEINSFGITGLWLVGIWERSPASHRIKQLYGRDHLISSAYSINGYEIDARLGSGQALDIMENNAARAGIHIACDMIPNHTGLDSPWVLDHSDWYISTFNKPVSSWEYNSEDLSPREGIQIRIEDGYYTQQEAAEVFQYTTSAGFGPLYIYHGNDGTSMPWNDTAQLDYLNPRVREEVKKQILEVARRFKIIRLDAAMTLIRQHFKRLWYPDPGGVKFIPTRDAFPMSQEEFDARMPNEFWAEVLNDLRESAPDALMLAEAFWLMEKYFVRELGMHRVYNSAFLNQLRDEENAQLKGYLREIIESDPTLLESFVNYLTTPDEAPAVEAFGRDEKYFGVCGLMAALPGLPMFGHGQLEGLSECYGMDFEMPMLDETPDQAFLDKHRRLISPLLKKRARFVSAEKMTIFDLQSDGNINDNVFAFTLISNGLKSLILYNNSSVNANGCINEGSCYPGSSSDSNVILIQNALELDRQSPLHLTEIRTGETRDIPMEEIKSIGMRIMLSPYQLLVYSVD